MRAAQVLSSLAVIAALVAVAVAWRQPRTAQPPRPGTTTMVVIGDSISKLRVLPDSPVPCGWPTNVRCHYSADGSLSYPTVIAQRSGAKVVNLAVAGAFVTKPRVLLGQRIPSIISTVPAIPRTADVVVFEGGTNDISAQPLSKELLQEVDGTIAAIRSQAPRAKLILLGVRYFEGCEEKARIKSGCRETTVDEWDAREREIASSIHGVFIDLRPLWPPLAGPDWPDGTHPGTRAVEQLAAVVLRAL